VAKTWQREPATLARLSNFVNVVIAKRAVYLLRHGESAFHLTDREASRLVDEWALANGKRVVDGVEPPPRQPGGL
jgi:hypothetical protein